MKYILIIPIIIFLLSCPYSYHVYGQTVLINEFMSDNETTIEDEDGEFNDWIELYNNCDYSVNMKNLPLTLATLPR